MLMLEIFGEPWMISAEKNRQNRAL